ncbi:MAG: hypothetical protein NT062_18740, partial [Proteobacteria bacterium]|nr:hypothetical protein [Pseudomonadota bacterium]
MKLLKIAAGLFALWLAVLVVLGLVGGRRMEQRVVTRVGEPLQATVTIGKTELALIRGHLDLEQVAVRREDGGHLAIDLASIRCELAPLGLALVDNDCRELTIRG